LSAATFQSKDIKEGEKLKGADQPEDRWRYQAKREAPEVSTNALVGFQGRTLFFARRESRKKLEMGRREEEDLLGGNSKKRQRPFAGKKSRSEKYGGY